MMLQKSGYGCLVSTRRVVAATLSAGCLVLASCGGEAFGPGSTIDPGGERLSALCQFSAIGETLHLQVSVVDGNGETMSDVTVAWSSTNPGIVSVGSDGVTLTAEGAGTANMAVQGTKGDETLRVSFQCTVAQLATSVTVAPMVTTLTSIGDTQPLAATAKDANGNEITGASLTWSSSAQNVATVSNTGLVTATGNGIADITASKDGASGQASITVSQVVETVEVHPASVTLSSVGASDQLAATARDANGHGITGAAFTWGSSEESVATVSANGLVTAEANGTATITATTDGVSGTASVTVSQAAETVVVAPVSLALSSIGATAQLTATARDANDHGITGAAFTWGSSEEGVATVSTNGLVTAEGNGTATITATTDGVSGTSSVTVTQAVQTVAVAPASLTLSAIGATARLTARARDAGAREIVGATFTWESSDELVATVSTNGLVTAEANGTATITATADGVSGTASVTVSQAAATVAVAPASLTLSAIGATAQLTATARDANGHEMTGAVFDWESSDELVATVNSTGLVTAEGNGTATISATTDGASGTTSVTVSQDVESVTVEPASTTLSCLNETAQLTATAYDANDAEILGATFAWESSDDGVATVSETGLVTAEGVGAATITATTGDVSNAATVTVSLTVGRVSAVPQLRVLGIGETFVPVLSAEDACGNPIPDAEFVLTSGDPSIASVGATLDITGESAGVTDISVESGGLETSIRVAVVEEGGFAMLVSSDVGITRIETTPGATLVLDFWMIQPPAGSGDVASVQGSLDWDPAQLDYESSAIIESGFSWFPNETDVDAGTLTFGTFSATGSTGTFALASVTFTVAGVTGGMSPLTLNVTAAGNALGADIEIRTIGSQVQIQ